MSFVVELGTSCRDRIRSIPVSDLSLTRLLKFEGYAVLPSCSFTLIGLQNAIKECFSVYYARACTSACLFFPCTLSFLPTGDIDVRRLSELDIPGVNLCVDIPDPTSEVCSYSSSQSQQGGRVIFKVSDERLDATVTIVIMDDKEYELKCKRPKTCSTELMLDSDCDADNSDEDARYAVHFYSFIATVE
ncbi:hypothetical protein AB6A40_003015 [Gnathostoma spinigerum]|uniref:Uncharacterized protein n=1 Tax=Gnathostoma spinigerum TaxID=75299 RepID=A0ABD6EAT6_9BILA